ncbi:MAG: PilT/PilU family type 4a pilus ATPase [Gammaproteobacteria bacterium]
MDMRILLETMVAQRASDLFITVGLPPSLKVDGRIDPLAYPPLTPEQADGLVASVMSEAQRAEFAQEHECNFAISDPAHGRFRVSAFRQRGDAGMVLRRIEGEIPTLESLHLPPVIASLAMAKRGLVIFVGGTGSGKSTSLAAMIGHRNRHGSGHIVTLEDPIEFVHTHAGCIITQREVGLDTASYAVGLKNTLRQAPDVILIGEIRTREAMDHAIAFAETGHLCLSTLHANNANQALDRIINFFPEDRRNQLLMDLAFNLKAVVAQQLIPSASGGRRRAAVEVLLNTPLAAEQIRLGEIHKLKELMSRSTQQGMSTFDRSLFELHKEGAISYDEAIRHADSTNEVRLMIKLDEEDPAKLADALAGVSLQDLR